MDIDAEFLILSLHFRSWEMFTDSDGHKKLFCANLTIYHDGKRRLMKDNEKLLSLNYCEIDPQREESLIHASQVASRYYRRPDK